VQLVIRIDAEADGTSGENGGADIVADRIAGEARQCRDPVWHMLLANRSQREKIIERQGTECADYAQRGEHDVVTRYFREGGQDHAGVDAVERADQRRDRKGNDKEACRDPNSFPTDPLLETAPQRGQHVLHLPSGRATKVEMGSPSRSSIQSGCSSIRPKTPFCAALDSEGSIFREKCTVAGLGI